MVSTAHLDLMRLAKNPDSASYAISKPAAYAGADGLELNFGCPHGMSERGMGSAVGQVPEYTEMITAWVKEEARTPVLVKLTPNISDVRAVARAAKQGGADGVSAINTINSITGIDLDTSLRAPMSTAMLSRRLLRTRRETDRVHMVQQIAGDAEVRECPSPASAAFPHGAMPPSSFCSAAAPCRSAPPRCTTAIASSKT